MQDKPDNPRSEQSDERSEGPPFSDETSNRCPACRAPIPRDGPDGLCPQCLVAGGIMSDRPTVGPHHFTPPSPEELDDALPDYQVFEMIGRGGMGAVYKARQERLNRTVAIKVLPFRADEDGGPLFEERFKREAQLMASLAHPNIVTVHDFGQTDDGFCFFVMEYIDGTDLHQLIHTRDITPAQALAIVPQICAALQYAHDRGIVHRDIKPANVMVTTDGTVKVTDFGLAKLLDVDATLGGLTIAGAVMGTPDYAAPEQFKPDGKIDHRADIYALGVVFYELLTGTVPKRNFAPPSQKVEIDVRLDEVVLRAMEEEPEKRYQQADEVKTDVEDISQTVPPPPARSPRSRANKRIAPIAATVLGCAVIGAALLYWPRPPNQDPQLDAGDPLGPPDYNKALAQLAVDPAAVERMLKVALDRLAADHSDLDRAEIAGPVVGPSRLQLDLSGFESLRDLSALRGLPITHLNLNGTGVADLQPLAGMQIRDLDIGNTAVRDVSILAAMPLERLRFDPVKTWRGAHQLSQHATLTSIAPPDQKSPYLAASSFWTKHENGEFIRSAIEQAIDQIKIDNPKASPLNVHFDVGKDFALLDVGPHPELRDLSAIAGLPLTQLQIQDSGIQNLEFLKGMPLRDLTLSHCSSIMDFSPLKEFTRLEHLALLGCAIRDLSFIEDLELKALDVSQIEVDDLKPLQSLPLESLTLSDLTRAYNLEPLKSLGLRDLSIQNSPQTDLKPLEGMALHNLSILNTKVEDLTPLQGMPLSGQLNISETSVSDLTPLKSSQLGWIDIRRSKVRDLTPLLDLPITSIALDGFQLEGGIEVLRQLTELREILLERDSSEFMPVEEFWQRYGNGEFRLQILMETALHELAEANPEQARWTFHWEESEGGVSLQFNEPGRLRDLSALRRLPLTELHLYGTDVSDLAPLRGLPLKRLNIERTRVDDLSPLEGMPLEHLVAGHGPPIKALEPLRGLPLKDLTLFSDPLEDPTILKDMPLEALELCLDRNVTDLSFLRGIGLRKLTIWDANPSIDLSVLSELSLESLTLDIADLGVSDLSFLEGLALTEFTLVAPHLTDISALSEMPLRMLHLQAQNLAEITPLAGMNIETLRISSVRLSDLSPLEGMQLRELQLSVTQVRDVTPLRGMPLEIFGFDRPGQIVKGMEVLRTMDNLKTVIVEDEELSANEFWRRYDDNEFAASP